jgi:hypothetical protein
MKDWEWIKSEGAVGELPVKIVGRGEAELLDIDALDSDLVEGTSIRFFEVRADTAPTEDDICILRAAIADVERGDELTIWVAVLEVEFVRRSGGETTHVGEMMQHLEGARKRKSDRKDIEMCENCREITGSTRLNVRQYEGRDLHFCGNEECGRLLSTTEYERWREIHW